MAQQRPAAKRVFDFAFLAVLVACAIPIYVAFYRNNGWVYGGFLVVAVGAGS